MADKVFVADYWLFLTAAERRSFLFTSPDNSEPPYKSIFSYDTLFESMRFDNYNGKSEWLNSWYYKFIPGFGVAEWRDDHPLSGWRRKLFGPADRHVFTDPIGWGNHEIIGENYCNYPRKNPLACWPPMFEVGVQIVHFEALLDNFKSFHGDMFKDVLVCKYTQKIGPLKVGARYYFARNVGPVALQWIGFEKSGKEYQRVRMDAQIYIERDT